MAVFQGRVLLKRAAKRLGVARESRDRILRLGEMAVRRTAVLEKGKPTRKRITPTSDSSCDDTASGDDVSTLLEVPASVEVSASVGVLASAVTTVVAGPQQTEECESDSDDEPIAYKFPLANKIQKKATSFTESVPPLNREPPPASDVDSDDLEFGIRYAADLYGDYLQSEDEHDLTSEEQTEASEASEEEPDNYEPEHNSKLSASTRALLKGLHAAHMPVDDY